MSALSGLFDISSFFIGILINLLLIAMICYYFKRKIDNLEVSQSEQAKMLYTIISQQQSESPSQNVVLGDSFPETKTVSTGSVSVLQGLNLSQLVQEGDENKQDDTLLIENSVDEEELSDESDNESEESESESESDEESEQEVEVQETKSIHYDIENDVEKVFEYDKMTVKELKEILGEKGIQPAKKNMKKQEIINMLVHEDKKDPEMKFMKSDDSELVEVDDVETDIDEEHDNDIVSDSNSVSEVNVEDSSDELVE